MQHIHVIVEAILPEYRPTFLCDGYRPESEIHIAVMNIMTFSKAFMMDYIDCISFRGINDWGGGG